MERGTGTQSAVALARTVAEERDGADATAASTATLIADVDALFAEHQGLVYAACLHYVGNPDRARDLAQDTMLTAFERFDRFRGESSFGTWLHGIARHKCYNALRKRSDTLSDDGVLEATDDALGALAKLREDERRTLLLEAAAAVLGPVEQEAVYLRYVEQLPQARITELLDIDSASGARAVLQSCRRKLGRELRRRLRELGHTSSLFRRSAH